MKDQEIKNELIGVLMFRILTMESSYKIYEKEAIRRKASLELYKKELENLKKGKGDFPLLSKYLDNQITSCERDMKYYNELKKEGVNMEQASKGIAKCEKEKEKLLRQKGFIKIIM